MREPSWLKSAVFYEIYPQSFYDSNGDGIGDLPGVIRKLDYVKELGANAIWLNPFYESPFEDAGYDVSDFFRVAKRYGTNEDFRALCEKAHALGIKVICDLIPCHTSVLHPWFQKSASSDSGEWKDRFIWCDNDQSESERLVKKDYDRSGRYYFSYYDIQPALNYGFAKITDPSWQKPVDHPACLANRKMLLEIMDYWIGLGCDGFRVDMAGEAVKDDEDHTATAALWKEVRAYFDGHHPECVLVPEWSRPFLSLPAGFHLDMFKTGGSLFRWEQTCPGKHSYFRREGLGNLSFFMEDYTVWLEKTKDLGYISLVTGDHDTTRLRIGRTTDEMKTVFAFLLTMPGVPMMYYGEEIGLRYLPDAETEGSGPRGGSRTPMQWQKRENAKNFGFSTANTLYLPQDSSPDAPSVEEQESDEHSLLHTVKRLIALRKSHPSLWADGAFRFVGEGMNYPMYYERGTGKERIRVLINPLNRAVSFEEKTPILEVLLSESASLDGNTVSLGAASFLIYRV